MNEEFLGELITYIISDPSDQTFLKSVRLGIDKLPENEQSEDVSVLGKFIKKLLDNDIKDTKQAIRMYDSSGFTDSIKTYVDIINRVNRAYKEELTDQLYSLSMSSELNPIVEKIQDTLRDMEAGNPGKSRAEYRNSILEDILDLSKRAFVFGGTRKTDNMLIIDPETGLGDTGEEVYEEVKHSATNRIKTIQAFDMLCGGGMIPSSLYIVCCLSGHGKSLIMQNLAIYASINNDPETLEMEDGYKPCILFISYEMKKSQLLQRQLSFFGKSFSNREISDMGLTKLNMLVAEESKNHGLKMPIIYDDQITSSDDSSTGQPTVEDIERSINSIMQKGWKPIFICVDYLALMGTINKRSKGLVETSGDGSKLLVYKANDCRNLARKFKIPVLTAQQLDSDAYAQFGQMQAYQKVLDIIASFGENMVRGSKQLRDEVEALIYGDIFKVPKYVEGSSKIEYDSYLALNIKKDRDNQATYVYSERDDQTKEAYRKLTERVRNDAQTRRFFQDANLPMCVIPLVTDTIKLHPEDYGRSIRTFYCNTQGNAVDFSTLKEDEVNLDDAFANIGTNIDFEEDEELEDDNV